jgi:hypothetical protein
MYTRLNDLPVYEYRKDQIDAERFNHVQIALKRLGDSIRMPIPKLRHLDLILQKDAWIIVDRALNDIAIAAWTDFASQNRANLHEPIKCQLRLYHANAELILTRTLEAMELLLGEQLAEMSEEIPFSVLEFPKSSRSKE